MPQIQLFADSTCDLPAEEVQKMGVQIIPLTIAFEDRSYREGEEIDPQKLFELIAELGVLPKTAAPSPAEFYERFRPFVEAGKTVLYIGLSSKISSTLENARAAAGAFPQGMVRVVDSLNLCGGIGALVRMAYRFLGQGMTVDAVVRRLEDIAPHYKLFFTMDKLDYLYKGGRCSSLQYVGGKLLGIRPIIRMSADGLSVWKKVRGKKNAVQCILDQAVGDRDNILFEEYHVACSLGNEKERQELIRQLESRTKIRTYFEYTTGCVITSHCGEGTVGMGYFLEE